MNAETIQGKENRSGNQEEEFDRELERLMAPEPKGKGKQKRAGGPKKPWSRKRKIMTAAAAVIVLKMRKKNNG